MAKKFLFFNVKESCRMKGFQKSMIYRLTYRQTYLLAYLQTYDQSDS